MIPVLFTCPNSLYLNDSDFDCYGLDRDAMSYTGNSPVIAHPPCRLFSKMKYFSKAGKCEKLYGYYSVMTVRKLGGIVEHPYHSSLFKDMQCDYMGKPDKFGGYLLSVNMSWFGTRFEKRTLLYIVGIERKNLPEIPISFNAITHTISSSKSRFVTGKKEENKSQRSVTPTKMIEWLKETLVLINSKRNGIE